MHSESARREDHHGKGNMKQVVISGTGLYTPDKSISTEELVGVYNQYANAFNDRNAQQIQEGTVLALEESTVEFVEKASGIKARYVLDREGILDPNVMHPLLPERANEEDSIQCELSIVAATEALEQANRAASDVDAVIVACSNMQRPYPAMAVEVQHALGIEGFAYDMNVACSSATFGLQAAADSIRSGSARCVMVVNPEICSGHLEFRDRDCHFIFGDACTALIVEAKESCQRDNGFEILGTKLSTHYSNNIRNNFGFLNRCDPTGIDKRDKLFTQNGRKVFKEVVPLVSRLITEHLATHSIPADRVKRLWLHQANLSMNQLISRKVLGREASKEEAPVILDRYANTSSAGSIIAFHLHNEDFREGEVGVICSFGAGYSAGSLILQKL